MKMRKFWPGGRISGALLDPPMNRHDFSQISYRLKLKVILNIFTSWIMFQTTRKSSCVNTKGIPIAAYQVLPEEGYPPPPVGVPLLARSDKGGYPRWSTPLGEDRQMDGWTDTCQNITFPRTSYAVGKNPKKKCLLWWFADFNWTVVFPSHATLCALEEVT